MDITEWLAALREQWERNASAISALRDLPSARGTRSVLDTIESNQRSVEDAVVALSNLARVGGRVRGRKPAWIIVIEESIASRGDS